MKHSTMLSLEKFMRAKKMEHEALIGFLPENLQQHLKVINKEVTELMLETALSIGEAVLDTRSSEHEEEGKGDSGHGLNSEEDKGLYQKDSGVRKVHIG